MNMNGLLDRLGKIIDAWSGGFCFHKRSDVEMDIQVKIVSFLYDVGLVVKASEPECLYCKICGEIFDCPHDWLRIGGRKNADFAVRKE